jgi:hypothetical protein
MSQSRVRKRMRFTLTLGAMAAAAFGAVYGLVAHQGIPVPTATTATTSIQAAAPNNLSSSQLVPANSGSSVQQTAPPVVHTRTRGS